jgi:hypothetical protein
MSTIPAVYARVELLIGQEWRAGTVEGTVMPSHFDVRLDDDAMYTISVNGDDWRTTDRPMAMTTITVDYENNGEIWWSAVRRTAAGGLAREVPAAVSVLLDGSDEVTVSVLAAVRARRWCEAQPGWYGGTNGAPHPLHFTV